MYYPRYLHKTPLSNLINCTQYLRPSRIMQRGTKKCGMLSIFFQYTKQFQSLLQYPRASFQAPSCTILPLTIGSLKVSLKVSLKQQLKSTNLYRYKTPCCYSIIMATLRWSVWTQFHLGTTSMHSQRNTCHRHIKRLQILILTWINIQQYYVHQYIC